MHSVLREYEERAAGMALSSVIALAMRRVTGWNVRRVALGWLAAWFTVNSRWLMNRMLGHRKLLVNRLLLFSRK